MADAIASVITIYGIIDFGILIFAFASKNGAFHRWSLVFNIISILYVLVSLFAGGAIAGESSTLGTAIIEMFGVIGVLVISIIGIIVNMVKISKYGKVDKGNNRPALLLLICLLPLIALAIEGFGESSTLKGADLVLVDKNYNGWVEASRSNLIVSDGECKQNEQRLSLTNNWERASMVRWEVKPGGSDFTRDHSGSNHNLSEAQKADMRAIFNNETRSVDSSEYGGTIYLIEDTDYYITNIKNLTSDSYLASHLYKKRQQICDTSGWPNEVYHKK